MRPSSDSFPAIPSSAPGATCASTASIRRGSRFPSPPAEKYSVRDCAGIAVSVSTMAPDLRSGIGQLLERDPEKACPGLDPGCLPVLGKRLCSRKKPEQDDE